MFSVDIHVSFASVKKLQTNALLHTYVCFHLVFCVLILGLKSHFCLYLCLCLFSVEKKSVTNTLVVEMLGWLVFGFAPYIWFYL